MSKVWFTSDLHFGHGYVAGLRGYQSVEEHDRAIVEVLSSHIAPDDNLWILGDLSLNPNHGVQMIAKVECKKHLIVGNHDRCSPVFRHGYKSLDQYLAVFHSVQQAGRRRIGGQSVLLSHYPYRADRDSITRYAQWRLPDLGDFLLHGHMHQQRLWTGPRELHVGWDAWRVPVPQDHIDALIRDRVLELERSAALSSARTNALRTPITVWPAAVPELSCDD